MRLFSSLFLFAVLAAVASAAEVSIVRVLTGWRDAASFKRISEYFSGRENTRGETMLRTHPDQRGGYYFLVRATNAGGPAAIRINVQMIMPADSKLRTHTFDTALKSGVTVLHLGLTGSDWPDAGTDPVAWKLDLLAPDGHVLESEKSYLWEKPAGN